MGDFQPWPSFGGGHLAAPALHGASRGGDANRTLAKRAAIVDHPFKGVRAAPGAVQATAREGLPIVPLQLQRPMLQYIRLPTTVFESGDLLEMPIPKATRPLERRAGRLDLPLPHMAPPVRLKPSSVGQRMETQWFPKLNSTYKDNQGRSKPLDEDPPPRK